MNYNIFNVNKIAFDVLKAGKNFTNDYSDTEQKEFDKYLTLQISKINIENKDVTFLRTKLLEMYANPLINKLSIYPTFLEEGE
jgi:hypothetical protein